MELTWGATGLPVGGPTSTLIHSLPFSSGRYEPDFDYGLSFDTELLTRALRRGPGVRVMERQILFHWPHQESFRWAEAWQMLRGLWQQHRRVIQSTTNIKRTRSIETQDNPIALNAHPERVFGSSQVIIRDFGSGKRQGPLSIIAGSKGSIEVFGQSLNQMAENSINVLLSGFRHGMWTLSVPCDVLLLPRIHEYFHIPRNTDVFVMGFRDQETMLDPPFSGIWGVSEAVAPLVDQIARGVFRKLSQQLNDPLRYSFEAIWALIIKPMVLSLPQWMTISDHWNLDEGTWVELWHRAQSIKPQFHIYNVPSSIRFINLNHAMDIYDFYQSVLKAESLEDMAIALRVRRMIGLNQSGSELNSHIEGYVTAAGSFLIRRSIIRIARGVELRVGRGVVIDESILEIIGRPGEIVQIPAGTVICQSHISGSFSEKGEDGFIYRVYSSHGIVFNAHTLQATFFLLGMGGPHLVSFPMNVDFKTHHADQIAGLGVLSLDTIIREHLIDMPAVNRAQLALALQLKNQLPSSNESMEHILRPPVLEIMDPKSAFDFSDLRLIIFDWHRSLVVGVKFWQEVIVPILAEILFGEQATADQIEEVKKYVEQNARKLGSPGLFAWAIRSSKYVVNMSSQEERAYIERYIHSMKSRRREILSEYPEIADHLLFEGAREFIGLLRASNIECIVLTAAYAIEKQNEVREYGLQNDLSDTLGRAVGDNSSHLDLKRRHLENLISTRQLIPRSWAVISDDAEDVRLAKELGAVAIGFDPDGTAGEILRAAGSELIFNGSYPGSIPSSSESTGLSQAQEGYLQQAIKQFDLPALDAIYLSSIWRQWYSPNSRRTALRARTQGFEHWNFQYAAQMSSRMREQYLPTVNYADLVREPANAIAAKNIFVTFSPMDGGIGQKIRKSTGPERRSIRDSEEIEDMASPFGSKGVDLGYDLVRDEKETFISIAEAKVLQLIDVAKQKAFGRVAIQPLVNERSYMGYKKLLRQTHLFDRIQNETNQAQSYQSKLQEAGVEWLEPIIQADLPGFVETNGDIGDHEGDPRQPGGHGFWGFMFLWQLGHDPFYEDVSPHVRVFGNGDSWYLPVDDTIAGYMVRNNIPILKLTTPATRSDSKGSKDGVRIIYLRGQQHFVADQMELDGAAEAEKSLPGQLGLFHTVGLSGTEAGQQPYNTNIIYLNVNFLQSILHELVQIVGDAKFAQIISPTPIKKPARETPPGSGRFYRPVDGSIGSVVHNLNAFFRLSDDVRIQHILAKRGVYQILNFVQVPRDKFLLSVKTVFDIWLQRYSDVYRFDPVAKTLTPTNSDWMPPAISLTSKTAKEKEDPYWDDLSNLVHSFGRASIRHLSSLKIHGRVLLQNAELAGQVIILNQSGALVDLNASGIKDSLIHMSVSIQKLRLEDVSLEFDRNGVFHIDKLASTAKSSNEFLHESQPNDRRFLAAA